MITPVLKLSQLWLSPKRLVGGQSLVRLQQNSHSACGVKMPNEKKDFNFYFGKQWLSGAVTQGVAG